MDNIIKEAQAPETPTFETLPKYVGEILNRVSRIESKLNVEVQEPQQEELFSEFIPKARLGVSLPVAQLCGIGENGQVKQLRNWRQEVL